MQGNNNFFAVFGSGGSSSGGATSLGDLTDVTLTSLESQQVLKYNGLNWENNFNSVNMIEVRNDEGSTIPQGSPLYSKGEIGGSNRILVGIADADDPSKMPCIGIAKDEMNTTDTKDNYGVVSGVYNENLSGFTGLVEGDILYVSKTGTLTQTKPTGANDLIQNIGVVIKTDGTIVQGLLVSIIGRSNDVPNTIDINGAIRGSVLGVKNEYDLPLLDGNANRVIKTDGAGQWGYGIIQDDGSTASIGTSPTSSTFAVYNVTTNSAGTGIDGRVRHNGTILLGNLHGIFGYVQALNTGNTTNANGVSATIQNSGSGTITNAKAFHSQAFAGTGTITNAFGLFLEEQTLATTNYGVYQEGSSNINYFEGSVGCGTVGVSTTRLKLNGATNGISAMQIETSSGDDVTSPNNGDVWYNGNNLYFRNSSSNLDLLYQQIQLAGSDETSDLTTGGGKMTFRMPNDMTLTEVRASVTTAPTGANIIVDINAGGTSIFTTNLLSIDAGEKTSTTATTQPNITTSGLTDDQEITIDIDQVGSTIAGVGLKVTLIGYRT